MQPWNQWGVQASTGYTLPGYPGAAAIPAPVVTAAPTVSTLPYGMAGYQWPNYNAPPVTPTVAAAAAAAAGWPVQNQQQQWDQWTQWQQQYAQWQQEYGDKYLQSVQGTSSATPAPPTGVPPATVTAPSTGEKRPAEPPASSQDAKKPRTEDATATETIKDTLVEMADAEKQFDEQFNNWEAQFNTWREQNANHPDTEQYKAYEAKWKSWRNQLLQRREQMRKKREAKMAELAKMEQTLTPSSQPPGNAGLSGSLGVPPPTLGSITSVASASVTPAVTPAVMPPVMPPPLGPPSGAEPPPNPYALYNAMNFPMGAYGQQNYMFGMGSQPPTPYGVPPVFPPVPPPVGPLASAVPPSQSKPQLTPVTSMNSSVPSLSTKPPDSQQAVPTANFSQPPPTSSGSQVQTSSSLTGASQGSQNADTGGIPGLDLINQPSSAQKTDFNPPSASSLIPKQQEIIQTPADSKPFDFPSPAKQNVSNSGQPPGVPPLMNFPPPGYMNAPFKFPVGVNSNPGGSMQGKFNKDSIPPLMGSDQNQSQSEGNQNFGAKQRNSRFSDNFTNQIQNSGNQSSANNFGDNRWSMDSPSKAALLPTPNISPFGSSGKDSTSNTNNQLSNFNDQQGFRGNDGPSRFGGRSDGAGFRGMDGPPGFRPDGPPPGFVGNDGAPPGFRDGPPPGYRDAPPPGYRGNDRSGFRGSDGSRGYRGNDGSMFRQNGPPGFRNDGPLPRFQDGPPPGFRDGPPLGFRSNQNCRKDGGFDADQEANDQESFREGDDQRIEGDKQNEDPDGEKSQSFSNNDDSFNDEPSNRDYRFPPPGGFNLERGGNEHGGPPPLMSRNIPAPGGLGAGRSGGPPPSMATGGSMSRMQPPLHTPDKIIEYLHKSADLGVAAYYEPVTMIDYAHGAHVLPEGEEDRFPPTENRDIFPKDGDYDSRLQGLPGRDFGHDRKWGRSRQSSRWERGSPPRDDARSREDRRRDDRREDRSHDRRDDRRDERRDDRRDDKRDDRRDDRRDSPRRDDRWRHDRSRHDDDRHKDEKKDRERDRDRTSDRERDRDRDKERERERERGKEGRRSSHSKTRSPTPDKVKDNSPKPIIENVNNCGLCPVLLVDDLLLPPGRERRPHRIVVILRGPPGSGKTYLAKLMKDKEVEMGGSAPRILALDDYFMVETEKEETDPESGRTIKKKSMEYEYEAGMEPHYRDSLNKAFRKTIIDGYFPFIIVDCVNDKLNHFEELSTFARQKNFQVYICEMDMDVQSCVKRNIHKRTENEIENIVKNWEQTPPSETVLDIRSLLQSASITEVNMEDTEVEEPQDEEAKDDNTQVENQNNDKLISQDVSEEKQEEKNLQEADSQDIKDSKEGENVHIPNEGLLASALTSKWDDLDSSFNKLDRLDGLSKARRTTSIKDWLQLPEDYFQTSQSSSLSGKKRVRWADLEERREQEKMRAIGFVVGQTDWSRMLDPSGGQSKLTQTKYI